MSSLEQWQSDNARYLAAALHWLRLCLTNIVKANSSATPLIKGLQYNQKSYHRHSRTLLKPLE
jgi:hypothetical protein